MIELPFTVAWPSRMKRSPGAEAPGLGLGRHSIRTLAQRYASRPEPSTACNDFMGRIASSNEHGRGVAMSAELLLVILLVGRSRDGSRGR